MRKILTSLLLFATTTFISSCAEISEFVKWPKDNEGGYAKSAKGTSATSRAPLDVPPELRGRIEIPSVKEIKADNKPEVTTQPIENNIQHPVRDRSVSSRIYVSSAAELFDAVTSAMTGLNMPVQSMDSSTATLTTGWIYPKQKDESSASTNQSERWHFVISVYQHRPGNADLMRLEIQTVTQAYISSQWVDKTNQRNLSDALFAAVEEHLN